MCGVISILIEKLNSALIDIGTIDRQQQLIQSGWTQTVYKKCRSLHQKSSNLTRFPGKYFIDIF